MPPGHAGFPPPRGGGANRWSLSVTSGLELDFVESVDERSVVDVVDVGANSHLQQRDVVAA